MTITEKKAAHAKLTAELAAGQKLMAERNLTQPEGDALEAKAKEAETLQGELDQYARISDLAAKGREMPEIHMPGSTSPEVKAGESGDDVVGVLGLGEAFVNSPEFKAFQDAGFPQSHSAPFRVPGLKTAAVTITRKQAAAMEAKGISLSALEMKAIPTIGAGSIRSDRIADVVRSAEMTRLSVRDVLNTQRTSSNLIEYLTITAPTVAAAPTAENAAKPEATMVTAIATAPVRTIAVWMPITEQQLQDIPQLQDIINTELLYQLALVEERQIVWGAGTGQELLGIFNTAGVTAGRTVGGDTIIDQIRRAMTDVLVAELMPNALLVHPLDWESVVLTKGTDSHYLAQVFPTADGGMRVWGLRVVESTAMQKPTTALATFERRFLVGDFQRGATLWDRMQASVAVGYINDDFTKNRRTIRAEERLAFGVKRPSAFKYRITAAEA